MPDSSTLNSTDSNRTRVLVAEGPYRDTGSGAGKWLPGSVRKAIKRQFMYYTTCPKCAKQSGKNYVVILAEAVCWAVVAVLSSPSPNSGPVFHAPAEKIGRWRRRLGVTRRE